MQDHACFVRGESEGDPVATKKKDSDLVASVEEARRLCDPKTRDRVMRRDRALPCSRCGHPIDFTLSGRHPAGPTLDHRGLQVARRSA